VNANLTFVLLFAGCAADILSFFVIVVG